ncbi:hemerythrin domain-containing protein [Salimicrobium jeotgali]|uniref:hemerythrin domain-containing protein n=1 Tax=Salimicrobium jeotgali TaxID=1230341 RepID=UPI000C84852F|nr:hemerythrin domain-containing protein [Salimicrobium jeotgali]
MWEEQKFQTKNKATRILENEHKYLQYLMEEWHAIVLDFANSRHKDMQEARAAFKELRERLKSFLEPLKNHTDKEEEHFFPALSLYIGKEQGPIMSIEEEHKEIEGYIGHFFFHSRGDLEEYSYEQLRKMTEDAGEAFEVLILHFVKEETVLFPMVDRVMLTKDLEPLVEDLRSLITQ